MAGDGSGGGARREHVVVGLLVVLFVAYFLTLCVQKWRAYGYGDFDLAIFDQAVWRTARFDGFFPSSIRFGSVFADHVPLILVVVVPLYWLLGWLVPGAVLLLAVQVLAVGSAAVPLHLLARREVGRGAGAAVAAAYLLHPATGYLVLFEFHPGALAVPFLCWTLWALHAERWRTFVVCALLALACREDVALPVAGIGVWALWRAWRGGRGLRSWAVWRWAALPVAAGAAWLVLALFVIIPAAQPEHAPQHVSPFVWLYAYHTEPGVHSAPMAARVAEELLLHPVECVQRAAEIKPVGEYTWHLLAPTGGLALLSPLALLPALPTWYLNVTSVKLETSSISYQYTANVLPFLFLGAIASMAWLGRRGLSRSAPWAPPGLLVVSALVSSFAWGKQLHPHTDPLDAAHRPDAPLQLYATDYVRDDLDVARDALLELVPADGSLVTTLGLLPHASARPGLWSWHYVRTGSDPVTGAPVETPSADHVLLDASDVFTFEVFGGRESGVRQRDYLSEYGVAARAGPLVLLSRGTEGVRPDTLAAPDGTFPEGLDGEGIVARSWRFRLDTDPPPAPLAQRGLRAPVLDVSWAMTRSFREQAEEATNGFREHGTLWARVVLTAPGGERRDAWYALTYGMVPISEWRPYDPARPGVAPGTVRATYPLLVPAGTWRAQLDVLSSAAPGVEPLASFDLGTVDVP